MEQKGFDYPVQKCLSVHRCKSQFLDADGCHAAAHCPSSRRGVMKKHNFLTRVVAKAGKEAGLNVKVEPDTFGLLLGEFSKSDCKRVFPKHASKSYREAVITAAELVASPSCALSDDAKRRSLVG